jgi:CRISPR-associated protein Cmr5
MSGLGQAAAFYKSKSKPHIGLYQSLSDWLCAPGKPLAQGQGDLLQRLVQADQRDYRAAQVEALALLQWVKKFAKAYAVEDRENDDGRD